MQEIEGQISEIIFQNETNGYTVCEFHTDNLGEVTVVGYLPFITKGDSLKLTGTMVVHKEYGEQFKVETFEKIMPKTINALVNYLSGGIISGVGPATAKRIVKKFGEETLLVMKTEPKRLAEIRGITEQRAYEICDEFIQKWGLWEIVSFLETFGISANNAQKVYNELGPDAVNIVEKNPYVLLDIVYNVNFKQIDQAAIKLGINCDFNKRIEAGIKYALMASSENGNTCVIKENLIEYVKKLLNVDSDIIENCLINCRMNDIIVIEEFKDNEWVFLKSFYKAEENVATKIEKILKAKSDKVIHNFEKYLKEVEKESEIKLSEMQLKAIEEVNQNNITIITGGPGTRKNYYYKIHNRNI